MLLPQSEIVIWGELFVEEWEQMNPEKARELDLQRREKEGVTEEEALSDIAMFKALMTTKKK